MMFSKEDKKTEKALDKALESILQIYTSAIDNFNESEEETNKKLYEYYLSSHIVRKSDYYKELESDKSIQIIKRENSKVEYVQLGEYKTNIDKTILEKIKHLEKRKKQDKANFKKMENTCKSFLNEFLDIENRFQKKLKSRDENLQYLLENGILELPRKKSILFKMKNWFRKMF